jgi:hypothetical protein
MNCVIPVLLHHYLLQYSVEMRPRKVNGIANQYWAEKFNDCISSPTLGFINLKRGTSEARPPLTQG